MNYSKISQSSMIAHSYLGGKEYTAEVSLIGNLLCTASWRCVEISATSNPYWSNVTILHILRRMLTVHRFLICSDSFLDNGALMENLAKRLGENIIPGLGEWPSAENMTRDRGIILPSTP